MIRTVAFMLMLCGALGVAPAAGGSRVLRSEFRLAGSSDLYEATCSVASAKEQAWPHLVVRRKSGTQAAWSNVAQVPLEGVRLPTACRAAVVRGEDGTPISVVIVQGDGDTRRWVYVVALLSRPSGPPKPRVLLREWHEGDVRSLVDKHANLTGLRLSYVAWHLVGDAEFPGHVLLTRTFTWSAAKTEFVRGPLAVDASAESGLTLVQLLLLPGAEQRLGIQRAAGKTGQWAVVLKPVGLLRTKIPPDMLWASTIEATLCFPESEAYGPGADGARLVKLRASSGG